MESRSKEETPKEGQGVLPLQHCRTPCRTDMNHVTPVKNSQSSTAVSSTTPEARRIVNPFEANYLERLSHVTVTPGVFAPPSTPPHNPTAKFFLSPEFKGHVCPDPIDEEPVLQLRMQKKYDEMIDAPAQQKIKEFFEKPVAPSPMLKKPSLPRTSTRKDAASLESDLQIKATRPTYNAHEAVQTSISVNSTTDFEAILCQWIESQALEGKDAGVSIGQSCVERLEEPYPRYPEALCTKCYQELSTGVTVPSGSPDSLNVTKVQEETLQATEELDRMANELALPYSFTAEYLENSRTNLTGLMAGTEINTSRPQWRDPDDFEPVNVAEAGRMVGSPEPVDSSGNRRRPFCPVFANFDDDVVREEFEDWNIDESTQDATGIYPRKRSRGVVSPQLSPIRPACRMDEGEEDAVPTSETESDEGECCT